MRCFKHFTPAISLDYLLLRLVIYLYVHLFIYDLHLLPQKLYQVRTTTSPFYRLGS